MATRITIPGISPTDASSIAAEMKRPEGTFKLRINYPELHNAQPGAATMIEIVTGRHFYRLVHSGASLISGIHSSPGGGTQLVSVDVSAFSPAESLDAWLGWSPGYLRLTIIDPLHPTSLIEAESTSSPSEFWVSRQGLITEVGSGPLKVAGIRVSSAGKTVMSPPAVVLWKDNITALRVLLSGESREGHLYDVVTANAALGILATGFETYCKDRMMEIEDEGMKPDIEALIARFGTKEEREQLKSDGKVTSLAAIAAKGESVLKFITDARINFQSFDECKRAFNKAYGISFGQDLNSTNQLLERVQTLLKYRHRIVHVSPLIGLLNGPASPPEAPEFSNKTFAFEALDVFDDFMTHLHDATLRLRPGT